MYALVYEGPRKMDIREIPECYPKEGEVKIRVKYCGICGSDLHGYTGASGRRIPPMIMGHEFTGVVTEVGKNVTKCKVGDRVSVLPVEYCGKCEFCRQGRMNVCLDRRNLGVWDVNGAFAEYICMHETFVYPLPDSVSDQEGALLEPLAVSTHALGLAMPVEGLNVLIAGAGTIGLLVLMLVKADHPGKVVVTNRSKDRLALARRFGADITVDSGHDIGEALAAAGLRDDIHVAIECAGAAPTCQQTIDYVRTQGRVVWVGNGAKMVDINMQNVVTREIDIRGSYAFTDKDFSSALGVLEKHLIPAGEIITDIVPFRKTVEAFETLTKPGKDIKILVDVSSGP